MKQKTVAFIAISVGLLLVCIGALTLQTPGSGSEYRVMKPYTEADGTELVSLTVNDFTFQINTRIPDSEYEVTWLTTEYDTCIQIGDFSACRIWIDGQEVAPNQTLSLALDKISPDRTIPVRILEDRTDWDRTVYIKTWPENLQTVSLMSYRDETPGLLDMLYAAGNYLVKCDAEGNVVFYRLSFGASDFQSAVTESGKYYTFLENDLGGGQDSLLDIPTCQAVVLNEQYQVIDLIQGTPMESGTVPIVKYGFQMLGERDYILVSAVPEIVYENSELPGGGPMGTHVVGYIVSRVKDGNVLWKWDGAASDILEEKTAADLSDAFGGGAGFADLMKFSDIAWDESNNCVYLAWRELDGLVRLDTETGADEWIDLPYGAEVINVDCSDAYDMALVSKDESETEVLSGNAFGEAEPLFRDRFRGTSDSGCISDDGTGRYLLVFYGETSNIVGSVFDLDQGTTLLDVLFPGRGEEDMLDRIVFEENR